MLTRDTGDFPVGPNLLLPADCVDAHAIRGLADTLEKLTASLELRGIRRAKACVIQLFVVDERSVYARVRAYDYTYKLALVAGEWSLV